jgi:hypothetical protein
VKFKIKNEVIFEGFEFQFPEVEKILISSPDFYCWFAACSQNYRRVIKDP